MTDSRLFMVPAHELREVWPQLRDRLQAYADRYGEEWIPEDIYAALANPPGTYLWTTGDLRGFVIVQVLASPYAKNLHVWVACNGTGARAPQYLDQMKEMAAEAGCTHITFESDRNGWLKALPDFRVRKHFSLKVVGD